MIHYRRVGALLLDEIAHLAGQDVVADELVRTLDALHETERQIVVADEQEPSAIRGLSDPCARLEASLVLALGAPDEATRRAILRQKCRQWGAMERGEVTEAALSA